MGDRVWPVEDIDTRWIIDIGDTHVGSDYGLTPPHGFMRGTGHVVPPSPIQAKINEAFDEFMAACMDEIGNDQFIFLHKGDVTEGMHHRSKEVISADFADQQKNSISLFKPIADSAAKTLFVRGTPAHAGEASETEELVAWACKAEKSPMGTHCHPLLVFRWNGKVVHVAHHIATTSTGTGRATALQAELQELRASAGGWKVIEAPDIVTRGHRHSETMVHDAGYQHGAWSVTTPGWQGKTGFAYKVKGGRVNELHVGGILWEYHPRWGAIPHPMNWLVAPHLPNYRVKEDAA